nr:phorbol-12-myristate-13-acetate-induced protein 1 isoform X1 [Chlorocebus sabaeus]
MPGKKARKNAQPSPTRAQAGQRGLQGRQGRRGTRPDLGLGCSCISPEAKSSSPPPHLPFRGATRNKCKCRRLLLGESHCRGRRGKRGLRRPPGLSALPETAPQGQPVFRSLENLSSKSSVLLNSGDLETN